MSARGRRRPMDSRRHELALIHVAAKQLSLEESDYRALLTRVVGVTSARDLDAHQRQLVLAEMKRLGWRPLRNHSTTATKAALTGKVRALLLDAGRDDRYADAIARSRLGADRWEWLDYSNLQRLVQMLAIDQRRRAASNR